MAYERIQVEPVAAALGAEIKGLDLREPLDDATQKEIHEAWMRHKVLFFREQPLTLEQHKDFARRFGDLHVHPVLQPLKDQGHPEVVILESSEKLPFLADEWHSDVTFERKPPMGSVLRAALAPPFGGDTLWASMTAAYDALSQPMKEFLAGLRAVHDGGGFRTIASDAQKQELAKDETTTHPVIRTHPETGQKLLFVNATFTRRIEGLKAKESAALLSMLYDHIATPDFSVRFRWETDSIAMWDNRCTQHRVVADARKAHRRMERITICGDEPV
jgi:taurine dioxygenase